MQILLWLLIILSSIHWMVMVALRTEHLTLSDIDIDELESEGTATSVAKNPQGKSRTPAADLLKRH
jgi:hypothetical protein